LENKRSIPYISFLKPSWKGSLYYLISLTVAGSFNPFIYVYFTQLGLTGEQVGQLATLSPVLTMLLATTVSSLADRLHRRILFLQIALACVAVVVFLLRFPTRFYEIAVLMFLSAVFSSPLMSLGDSLIARMAKRENISYGGMRLWGSFGFAVSALGFGIIWQIFGYEPMFIVTSLLYIPLILVAGTLEEPKTVAPQQRLPMTHLFRDTGLVFLLVATFFASISNSLFMTFSGIYVNYLGGGNFLIGLMTAFGAFAELPMMFYSDRFANWIRKPNVVILSYILMGVAFTGYVFTTNPNVLPWLTILKGLGYGLWFPTTVKLVVEHSPDEWAATSQSLLAICMFGLAPIVAGPVGGWIHDVISPGAVFGLGVVTLIIAAFIIWGITAKGQLE